MEQLVAQFPKQIADAISIAENASLTFDPNKAFRNVVICGMGGSGIGGKMVAQLFESEAKIPLVVVQDYTLPAFVDKNTLVIASSYSGMTEETLSAVYSAEEKGATLVGVSSGGDLLKFCKEKNYNYITLPAGNPPRSMLAFSMIQLIQILAKAGVIHTNALSSLDNCRKLLNEELISIKKAAQVLGNHLFRKQGVIYTDTAREGVAIRARQQFNENSKQLVWHHVIPEMNHNELVGWGGGDDRYSVVFLESQFLSDRNQLRTAICKEIIEKKTPHVLGIQGKGKTMIEEYFYFIHIIDWASLILANLNKTDAVEVRVIDYLKDSLNKA